MPETRVKLRPGSATPVNVRLYQWQEAGALSITAADSGQGLESVYVDRSLVVQESASGVDSALAALNVAQSVSESGYGADALAVLRTALDTKHLESILRHHYTWIGEAKPIRASPRVHATVVDEGRLSVSGEPDRLQGGYIYPLGYIDNLRGVEAQPSHVIYPRIGSQQKTPKGWSQTHLGWTLRLYTLGRNNILDNLMDESGDNVEFDLLDIRCLDKHGYPCNIFAEKCVIAGVEAAFERTGEVSHCYELMCSRFSQTPRMHLLKMVQKPISSPLTIEMIHPEIKPYASILDLDVAQDYDTSLESSSTLRLFSEQSYEETYNPVVDVAFYFYEGHVWLISAVVSEGGALDFAGWEEVESGSSKPVAAYANTGDGYVIANATPFSLDDEAGLGRVDEFGAASFTVPAQADGSAYQIACAYSTGWGLYAKHTNSNGYRRFSQGSGVSAGAYQSSINPPSGYHVEWFLDGSYLGRGSSSPEIPAQSSGSYHVLDSAQVAN